jgi:hypothetical protein
MSELRELIERLRVYNNDITAEAADKLERVQALAERLEKDAKLHASLDGDVNTYDAYSSARAGLSFQLQQALRGDAAPAEKGKQL